MENPKAFVAYAGEDVELAREVSEALRATGIEAFFAGWEIAFGDDFVKKINEGLSGASFFVLLVSTNFLRKGWPMAEQSAATVRMVDDRARIIPINLGVAPTDFPPLIRTLRWVSGEDRNAREIAARISEAVFGSTLRPPLGPLPQFLEKGLNLADLPSLTTADKAVLRLVFEIGAENLFRADFEELGNRALAAGIDAETMKESLEVLEQAYLLKIERHLGGIYSVVLTTLGAEECSSELVPNYPKRKREVLCALVNASTEGGKHSDALAERTGEPLWLVCHILRDAERHGDVKMHAVHVGHEHYSIDSVAPSLKRKLERHDSE